MGQTLTHGVYLPDEGERNCYSGLAANWQLLDTSVGTIAEHTSALSGKAPLVHTHSKSDITDFPAYGNAAGTICEGNDSRLSDARTPVAHTHGKSDITDLFNSANTWSGEQTFSQTIQGNAATASAFDTAKSITLTGAVTGTVSGTNSWKIATVLKTGSASTGGTVPNPYFKIASWEVAPNKYFGAILQIQNKCYPHNTATLTISVRTKTDATFQRGYSLLNNTIGHLPREFILCYKEVTGKVLCELYFYSTVPYNGIRFSVISEGIQNDNSLFNTMVVYQSPEGIAALPSDYTVIQTTNGTYTQDFIPYTTNTYDLGTSSLKWKTLNGINPGALSLPDTTREEPIDRTNWVYDYGANSYYPPEDGWLAVACSGSDYIQIDGSSGWGLTLSKGYDGYCVGIIPVKKNVKVQIRIRATSSGSVVVRKASFYPGTGDPSFTVTPLNNS